MSVADRSFALSSSSGGRNRQRSNFELYAWLFMRVSGVVLVDDPGDGESAEADEGEAERPGQQEAAHDDAA